MKLIICTVCEKSKRWGAFGPWFFTYEQIDAIATSSKPVCWNCNDRPLTDFCYGLDFDSTIKYNHKETEND